MDNQQKGFSKILLLILLVVLGIGGYILSSNKSISEETDTVQSVVPEPEFQIVTIQDLSADPSSFLNKKIQVTGKLILAGKDYFTDPVFAITDGANQFKVGAWLVLEIPPRMPNATGMGPSTMKTYLDKTATLKGVVEKSDTGYFITVSESSRVQ